MSCELTGFLFSTGQSAGFVTYGNWEIAASIVAITGETAASALILVYLAQAALYLLKILILSKSFLILNIISNIVTTNINLGLLTHAIVNALSCCVHVYVYPSVLLHLMNNGIRIYGKYICSMASYWLTNFHNTL